MHHVECSASGTNDCTICLVGSFLLVPPLPSYCGVFCNIGYYPDLTSHQCLACDNTCEGCNATGTHSYMSCITTKLLQAAQ